MIVSFLQIMGSFSLGFIITHMFIYKVIKNERFAGNNPISRLFNKKG